MSGNPPLRAHYPVAIAGAGPTGLTLANLLGVYGIECLLLERNPATVHEPRAVSIDDESLRTMQAVGIADKVIAETVAGYGSHYYSPDGSVFAKVQPKEQPFGYPRRNAFRQPILEQQLRRALGRFEYVTAEFNHELVSFDQDADRVKLQIRRADGGMAEVSCDYLVGCDGASSSVRRALGIALGGSTFQERWLIVDLEDSPSASPHTKVFADPARPCLALPGPHNTRRYEFMLHPQEADADILAPDRVQHLLATHEADPASRIVRTAVYAFHARIAESWSAGRVFLAGDAAHLMPPFAGQGMNSGLRDAANLAWKLAAVLRGTLGPGLLDSYEAERRDHVKAMTDLALRMGRIMGPRSRMEAWFVQNAFRLLGLWPAARDYLAEMKYKPAPRFLRGFFLPDGKDERHTLVGRLFPQPRVSAGGGDPVLFDDILGHGFSLLVRSPRPAAALEALDRVRWPLKLDRIVLQKSAAEAPVPGAVNLAQTAPEKRLAPFTDHLFLLRPDRYVAACIPVAEVATRAPAIDAMFKESFAS